MPNSQPLINQLNLVVRDMDAILAFYRRVGLEIPDGAVWKRSAFIWGSEKF
jgi:hypothetical protein